MKFEVDVELTPEVLARAFCDMNDEEQADFFIHAAAIAAKWSDPAQHQWMMVGIHLKTCECSTFGAREMIRNLADGLDGDDE